MQPKKILREGQFVAVLGESNDAEILIYEQIGETFWGDGMSARRFKSLLGQVKGRSLKVRVNSGGGEIFDGLAIANTLRDFAGDVTTIVDGLAASMASIIFLAGKTRIMQPGTMLMIHEPATYIFGDKATLEKEAELLDKIGGQMADLYAKASNLSTEEARKLMRETTWMTAEESLSSGFATEVSEHEIPDPEHDDETTAKVTPAQFMQHWDIGRAMSVSQLAPPYELIKEPIRAMHVLSVKPAPHKFSADEIERIVGIAAPRSTPPGHPDHQHQEQTMSLTKEQREAETKRKMEIRAKFAKFPVDHLKLLDECLDDFDCTPQMAAEKLLVALGSKSTPTAGTDTVVNAGADARQKFVLAAEKAILFRVGLGDKDNGNELNGLTLREMARESLRLAGVSGIPSDPMRMVGMSFTTTSDFPIALENIANKALLKGYSESEETFEIWTSPGTLTDFKRASRVGLSEFSNLDLVPEHGEFKQGMVVDRGEYVQLDTYGKLFNMSRQAIINDDASVFTDVPRKMGRAAKRTVANNAYGVLSTNPVMRDGVQYLNAATHKNVATAAYPTVAVLDAMRTQMGTQKDVQGIQNLNITPFVIVTSLKLKGIITELVRSKSFEGNNSGRENRVLNMVENIIADSRLDAVNFGGGVGNAYFLFASPSSQDTVEVNYLNGVREPTMERMESWNIDGTSWKVRIDTNAAPLDFRTVVANYGAAAP